MILCQMLFRPGGRDLGWWNFEVLPQPGEAIMIPGNLDSYYQVAFVMHRPVEKDMVDQYNPPYVKLVVEALQPSKLPPLVEPSE